MNFLESFLRADAACLGGSHHGAEGLEIEIVKARVMVTLKNGILDPQGKAIEGALKSLGINGVESVRQGKLFEIELATEDRTAAAGLLHGACEKLLANQVIENFQVEVL